ncbi:hypothetical protein ACJMK2_006473 [Sinanodonta woodiana]|uniref:Uncharacterized protein n=1 Tax=Sinanodonta woodiana TaxID=1069815 RepID=A0ABD3VWQ5_SINWO
MEVKQITMFSILMIMLVVDVEPCGKVEKRCVIRDGHCSHHPSLIPGSPKWHKMIRRCAATEVCCEHNACVCIYKRLLHLK